MKWIWESDKVQVVTFMLALDLKLLTKQQGNYKAVLSFCSLQASIEVTAESYSSFQHHGELRSTQPWLMLC